MFHQPEKFAGNPIIAGDGGYVCVHRDWESGLFRMRYQTWQPAEGKKAGDYAIAYAQSTDGVHWDLPALNLFEWKDSKENNIVWRGIHGRRASSVFLLELPDEAKRGHRFVFLYRERDGMRLIGSQDGIHWDAKSDTRISPIHSDTQNSLVYDPRRQEFVMFCRAKHIYRTFRGDVIDTGASRRVARMANAELWQLREQEPQTILIPDEQDGQDDFHFFYGMPLDRMLFTL